VSTLESFLAVRARGSASGAADLGVQLLGVRKDAATALADADGKYAPLQFDANGNARVVDAALAGFTDNLETLVAATNTALATVNSALAGLGTNTDGLETLIAATNTALGTVNTALTALQTYTDGLETLIGTSNTNLTTIHTDLATTLAGLITTLNGYVDGLEALAAAATPAGTNIVGRVGQSVIIDVTLSLDTGIYAANELLADTQAIANLAAVNDVGGILQYVQVIDEDDVGAAFDIYFLDANNTFGTENSAPTITDANARSILGKVPVAVGDYTDLGGVKLATLSVGGMVLRPASGTTTGYLAVVNGTGTPTYTASGVRLRLHFLRD